MNWGHTDFQAEVEGGIAELAGTDLRKYKKENRLSPDDFFDINQLKCYILNLTNQKNNWNLRCWVTTNLWRLFSDSIWSITDHY